MSLDMANPTVAATVNWPANQSAPSVDPVSIVVSGPNTQSTWNGGNNVESVQISGLNQAEFGTTGSNGYVTTFTVTDPDNTTTDYSYTVSAIQASTRMVGSHDPQIKNGS